MKVRQFLTRMINALSRISILLGTLLLLLNLFGLMDFAHQTYIPEDPVPGYNVALLSPAKARDEFKELLKTKITQEERAERLLRLVGHSFIHSNERYYVQPWDNWVYWILDQIVRVNSNGLSYLPVNDGDLLWRRGQGFCSQAALIFVQKAKQLGLMARVVSIPGHVLAQVDIPAKGWLVVDPDYSLYWGLPIEKIHSELGFSGVREHLIRAGHRIERAEYVAQLYMTPADDWATSTSDEVGSLRHQDERLAASLSWYIPYALISIGILLDNRLIRRKS